MVGIFGTLIFMAIWSLGFLTKTDASTTQNLLRELHATYLAESIAAQVDAQVNTNPWNQRFWFVASLAAGSTGTPMATINKSSPFINLSGETLPPAEFDFTGVIKDLPDELRQYRLYLEVTVRGETYSFSWDKRHEQTLLSGLAHDNTEMDKVVEIPSPVSATDNLIDGIKTEEIKAPATDNSGAGQKVRVSGLRRDRRSHRARTLLPDPKGAPSDPQDQIKAVNDANSKLKDQKGKGQ